MASVVKEIRQTRQFESRGEEAVVTLLRTADSVRAHLARVVEPPGITEQQYNVLRILRGAGAEGLPTLEIGSRMIERCPGVTRLIDRLEVAGLVARERGSQDRRQMLCRMTKEGRSVLARLDAPVRAAAERCMAPLGRVGLQELVRLLDLARAASEAPPSDVGRKISETRGDSK